jgi:hypothetical protein
VFKSVFWRVGPRWQFLSSLAVDAERTAKRYRKLSGVDEVVVCDEGEAPEGVTLNELGLISS